MPMGLIQIEEHLPGRWTAEVEIGGLRARRVAVTGDGFDDIMSKVKKTYYQFVPDADPRRLALQRANEARAAKKAAAVPAPAAPPSPAPPSPAPPSPAATAADPGRVDPRVERLGELRAAAGLGEDDVSPQAMLLDAGWRVEEITPMRQTGDAA